MRRWRAPRRSGGARTPPAPSRVQVAFALRGREDGRHDARPGRHRLGRVAVRHDEAHVGIGRHDRFEVEVVVRRLEQPQVRRASRLQELDDAPVVVVRRRQVGSAPPGVVAVDRKRVLLPVERHAEQLGVLHRRVDVVEVHRLAARARAARSPRASCSRRGSVASLSSVGGGHGCDCSHPRRQRNCGSSDIMLARAVVPVRGSPLMSTGPRTGSSAISGWSRYHASTSRRLTRRRRRSPITSASVAGLRSASRSRLSSSTSRPSRKSPGPKSERPVACHRLGQQHARCSGTRFVGHAGSCLVVGRTRSG